MRAKPIAFASVVLVLLSLGAALRAEQPKADDPAIIAIRAKLDKTVTLRVTDVPMSRLLELLAKNTDVPLKISGKAEGDAFDIHMSLNVQNARAIDILDAMYEIIRVPYDIRNTGIVFNNAGTPGD